MLAWIKKYWKIIAGALLAIGGFIFGLLINRKPGWLSNTNKSGVSGGDNGSQGLAVGLGKLESGQQELKDGQSRLEENQRRSGETIDQSGRTIDRAEARLDKLDKLLGISKNP